ncbi:hypothetical protein CY35_11G052500 [Sphagnum magellanicum]|nr:hypothetical protein CY35_11G052500 [Sphagnum magellanicum]
MSYLIQQPSVLGEEIFTCGDCCALDRKELPYTGSLTCNNRQVHLMCLEWAPECWYTAGIYGGC